MGVQRGSAGSQVGIGAGLIFTVALGQMGVQRGSAGSQVGMGAGLMPIGPFTPAMAGELMEAKSAVSINDMAAI